MADELSVGTLPLTGEYHVEAVEFPPPALKPWAESALAPDAKATDWPDDKHELSQRTVYVRITSTTAALAYAAWQTLAQTAVPGVSLYWKPSGASELLESRIVWAAVSQPTRTPAESAVESQSGTLWTTVTFVCEPYWLGPEQTLTEANPSSVPAVVSYTDPTVFDGDVPAVVQVKTTLTQGGDVIAVGLRSGSEAPIVPGITQDYQGTTDTLALSGQAVVSGTLTGTYANLGTPTTFDGQVYRGRYLVVARAKSSLGGATMRAVSSITGSGISDVQTETTPAVAVTMTDYHTVCIGEVNVPAAAIPKVDTSAGYGAEAVQAQNTVDEGTKTFTSESIGEGRHGLEVKQTFPSFRGRVTAVEYTVDTAPTGTLIDAELVVLRGRDGYWASEMHALNTTVGTHKVTLHTPLTVLPTDSVYFALYMISVADSQFTMGLAYSNGDYASGAVTTPTGSGEAAGDDLTFKVYGQPSLSFDATVQIQVANASGGTVSLDTVALVPVDECAVVVVGAFDANRGILIDTLSPARNVYLCNSTTGIGQTVLAYSELRNPFLFRPGAKNHLVIHAGTPTSVAPTGCKVRATYRCRYTVPINP